MDYGKDFPETGPAPFGTPVDPITAYATCRTPTRLAYFLHMARYFHKREAQHMANNMPISAEQAAYEAGKYLRWAYAVS